MSGTERTAERIIIEYEPAPTKGKEKNRWLGQVILRAYFKLFDEVLPSIRKHGVHMSDSILDQVIQHPEFPK